MPESRDCSVIGKFTQGAKADGKRLTRRLVTDRGELDYLVRDTRQSGTLVGAPERYPLGHILTYYDGSLPQNAHLRASMLAYAHINLLSMLQRFEPEEAVRVAPDSIYVRKSVLHKAFVAPKNLTVARQAACSVYSRKIRRPRRGQGRDKGENFYMPMKHAAYLAKPDYKATKKDLTPSTAPRHDDRLSRHRLSYLNGGGGSGKTTRAIGLFRRRNSLVFTRPIAWPKRCRPRASRPRHITASSAGAARQTGRPNGWDRSLFPVRSYGTRSTQCPALSGNLPRLARGSGHPGHLLRRPGAAAPNRRRNATRLAPRACQLLRGGRGRPQSQRPPPQGPQKGYSPPTRPSTVSGYEKGASRLFRVGTLRGGLEDVRSHLDLQAEGSTGPRGCCSSAMRSIFWTPPFLYCTAPKTLGGRTSWSQSLGPYCWMAGQTRRSSS